jgi:hypothetical protein
VIHFIKHFPSVILTVMILIALFLSGFSVPSMIAVVAIMGGCFVLSLLICGLIWLRMDRPKRRYVTDYRPSYTLTGNGTVRPSTANLRSPVISVVEASKTAGELANDEGNDGG